ncbi:MAG: hypothetical protein KKF22_11045 [Gammaproteobacteria bacterium]|nr:hypothetical protein [Gammaproteobacteria bacterium]
MRLVMIKTISFILVALAFETHGSDVTTCAEEDVRFVRKQHVENRLSAEKVVEEKFMENSVNVSSHCLIKTELMMDGLSFMLYKGRDGKESYIRVYNDFDGTSKLYGPFI